MSTACADFAIDHLTTRQQSIARAVLRCLPEGATGGGCRAFYSPAEWRERGEEYGRDSLLILVHDGGDLATMCSLDYGCYQAQARLVAELRKRGLFVEQCTTWYSAVYRA